MGSIQSKRNSAFELVKIIGIILIVFCHCIPTERIEYHYATDNLWHLGIILFRQFGSIGNAIFMVSSTWFLVDNDATKLKKVKEMIANNQLISLIFLAAMFGFYSLSAKEIIKQVFPFLFSTLWYITCYILYYCIHGIINKGLRGTEVNSRCAIIVLLSILCVIFIIGGLYFNELVGFVIIHAITWFVKKELIDTSVEKSRRIGLWLLIIGILGWLFGAVIFNFVGLEFDFLGSRLHHWNRFYNPFVLAIAYGSCVLASNISFTSRFVNEISSCSLYIYIITGNQLLRTYLDNDLYDVTKNLYGSSMYVCFIFVIAYSVFKFVVGLGLALLYKNTAARMISHISAIGYTNIAKRSKHHD